MVVLAKNPPHNNKHRTSPLCSSSSSSIVHLWCQLLLLLVLLSSWTALFAAAKEFALPTESIGDGATATADGTQQQHFNTSNTNPITTRRARADAFLAGTASAARIPPPPRRTLNEEQQQQEDRRLQLLYTTEDEYEDNNENNNNNLQSDIIDGIPVTPNNNSTNNTTTPFPSYAVPFGYLERKNSLCGGVLIHADIVLTAAHCRKAWAGYAVYIGATRLDGTDALDTITAAREYVHPNFTQYPRNDIFRLDNDLLLVVLERPVNDTDNLIRPSKWNTDPALPILGDSSDDESHIYTILGFGETEEERYSVDLLQARVPAVDERDCRRVYKSPPYFPDTMLCAGTDDTTTCAGDSGGPLLDTSSDDDTVVMGILSFGKSDCDEADVFVKVSAFADWIRDGVCALSAVPPSDCGAESSRLYEWPAEPDSWSRDDQVSDKRDYCASRDPCRHWLWGDGVTMYNAGDFLFFWDFCWEHCITFWPEVALFFNWQCGYCPSFL